MDKKKYYKRIFGYFKDVKGQVIAYAITSFLVVGVNTISPSISAKREVVSLPTE